MSKQVKNTVAVLAFTISKKAQLPAIRVTEQPILLTKGKINGPGHKFSKYFRYKGAGKSRTRSCPRPRKAFMKTSISHREQLQFGCGKINIMK